MWLCAAVFDDGDENTLRRSKLCLKGSRHFMKSEVSNLYRDCKVLLVVSLTHVSSCCVTNTPYF